MSKAESRTRNSRIREIFQKPLEVAAHQVHEHAPKLTPNHVSALSFIGVSTAVLLTFLKEKRNGELTNTEAFWLILLYVASSLLDGFDGSLSREIDKQHPDREKPTLTSLLHGQIADYLGDRAAEILIAWLGTKRAEIHSDELWYVLSCAVSISNVTPSYLRALAESVQSADANVVPEAGTNILQVFGSRQGRFAIAIGTLLPYARHKSGVSLQALLTVIQLTAGISTTIDRHKIAVEAAKKHDPALEKNDTQKLATTRKKVALLFMGGAAIFSAASLVSTLRKRN